MSDVRKLEEKLNNLESRLKAVFEELEKRLNELAASHADNLESRFQELEDIVLLVQVEQMKLVERVNSSIDISFPSSAATDSRTTELERLVHQIAERVDAVENAETSKADFHAPKSDFIEPEYRAHTLEKLQKILAG
ncbi:MAG: hypothetical protein HY513_00780 [Candidatus Aenigmarchaeota archaeon]|nr:hypothetical protein [Candidatus Aenigmarchaeota archaeon]